MRSTSYVTTCIIFGMLFHGAIADVAHGIPIAVENSDVSGENSNTSSASITGFAVGSNTNRLLLVAVGGEISEVDSVSYGGTPLTAVANIDDGDTGGPSTASIWALDNPAVGTDDIDVTISGTDNSWHIGALSLTSAGLMSIVAMDGSGSGSGGSPTLNFSPLDLADDYFMLSVAERNNNGSLTPPSGLTTLFNDTSMSGGATVRSDYAFFSDTSTDSFSWSFNTRHALVGVAVQSALVPEPGSGLLALLGLALVPGASRRRRRRQSC